MRVGIEEITVAAEFQVRHDVDPEHVKNLARALVLGEKLPPLLVWRSPEGLFVLLDGEHRYHAHRWANRQRKGSCKVAVRVLNATRTEAHMAALAANVRDKRPMTRAEKLDWAWKMVRDSEAASVKKATLARAAGIHRHTVDKMTKRFEAMQEADEVPSGKWAKDQGTTWTPEDVLSAADEAIATAEMTQRILEAVGFSPRRQSEQQKRILLTAIMRALPKRLQDELAEDILGERLVGLRNDLRDEMVQFGEMTPEDMENEWSIPE